ncbi:hypothetical protein SCUP515_09706 [Seiridium cupressi]
MTPGLPLEIWAKILGHVTDPCYIPRTWLNSRRVSHAFKAATEMAFVDVYLPQTRINVELAEVIELTFDGLLEDRGFVRYKHVFPPNPPSRISRSTFLHLQQHTERIWQREHNRYLDRIKEGSPHLLYHISFMTYVEDPWFPDFDEDIPTKRSLSFRWKPMLSTMFGEIEYRKWLLRRELEAEEENGPASSKIGVDLRRVDIELHVRRIRPQNRAWDTSPTCNRRQEWQVSSLNAYRPRGITDSGPEEDWGTFYNHVTPRFKLGRAV